MRFPRNMDEYNQFLEWLRIEDVQPWLNFPSTYDRTRVLKLVFLRTVWESFEKPSNSTYHGSELALRRKEAPEVCEIIDKILGAGVTPEELSRLIFCEQFELVCGVLYALVDPVSADFDPDGEVHFSVYSENEDRSVIPESRWSSLSELLSLARCSDDPELPEPYRLG